MNSEYCYYIVIAIVTVCLIAITLYKSTYEHFGCKMCDALIHKQCHGYPVGSPDYYSCLHMVKRICNSMNQTPSPDSKCVKF